MGPALEGLVERAKDGDDFALEEVLKRIQDRVYGLALRMLAHPPDAEDATQEILLRISSHIRGFRNESAFSTWVYRVACNYLLTARKGRAERKEITLAVCERQVDGGIAMAQSTPPPKPERDLFVKELMFGCVHAIILALDRNLRIAFILGEVFETTGQEASEILGIRPAAYRKRLSRARRLVRDFMTRKCGLVNPENECRCEIQAPHSVATKWINPDRLRYATHPVHDGCNGLEPKHLEDLDELQRIRALFQGLPEYKVTDSFVENMRLILAETGANRRDMEDARGG